MLLPSNVGGPVTTTVGFFESETTTFADWMVNVLEAGWQVRPISLESLADAVEYMQPVPVTCRFLLVPIGVWTVLLSNGPGGTDVGVLPSYAARELGCRAIRAVKDDEGALYPARILGVYGPDGEFPHMRERSIAAANDGGRWVFEAFGTPYPFEDLSAYSRRRKPDRFTADMLESYLRALDVPIDLEPDWGGAWVVELVN